MLFDQIRGYSAQLLSKISDGDEAAIVEFHRVFGPVLLTMFENLGWPRQEAENLAIEAAGLVAVELPDRLDAGFDAVRWIEDQVSRVHGSELKHLAAAAREQRDTSAAQAKLIGRLPTIPGLETVYHSRPKAEGSPSGDFVRGLILPADQNGGPSPTALVAVGDASGKGGPASLYAALTVGLLEGLVNAGKTDPGELMINLNALLAPRGVPEFVCLQLLAWHPREAHLTVTSAGAHSPVILSGERLTRPRSEGIPLGLFPDVKYEPVVVEVQQGDLIVAGTDGVFEQQNDRDELYETERLRDICLARADRCLASILEAIISDLYRFAGPSGMGDDHTLAVIRIC